MRIDFTRSLSALALLGVVSSVSAVELKSVDERFSYALGVRYAQQFMAQDVVVDGAAFGAAINDVYKGGDLQMTPEEMKSAIQAGRDAVAEAKQAKATKTLEAGRKFLEQNKSKPGVVTLPSGLQYIVQQEGSGASPGKNSKVTVHYTGTLLSGKEFDSSHKRGQPAKFMVTGVIPGFSEALQLMKPGAKWKVFIPSELGYGPRGAGSSIGPNETLIFDLELIASEEIPVEEKKPAEEK